MLLTPSYVQSLGSDWTTVMPFFMESLSPNLIRLQRIKNSLTRIICLALYRSSTTGFQKALHWLHVHERITYKIMMTAFKIQVHQQPAYLLELISTYLPSKLLRSSSKNFLVIPKTKTFASRIV